MTSPGGGTREAAGRRFQLKALIGAGAFGEVFLAEQESGAGFRRQVVVKMLGPEVSGSPDAARRMRDEARILGRLNHRGIVSVLDLVRFGERWAIVMEHVPGADLAEVVHALELQGQPFPAPAALEAACAICRALDAAWRATDGDGSPLEVVHRDIKPSNVRLTPDGDVKVLDFGVARVSLAEREAQTRTEAWIGTERYMAPERILLEGDTAAGDVYAVGATLFEMLAVRPLGRTPVLEERHAPFVEANLAELRVEGPPEVVAELRALLGASLAATPGARPDAGTLGDGLARLARRLPGPGLAEFSRALVPQVPALVGNLPRAVDGMLVEHSTNPTLAGTGGRTSETLPLPTELDVHTAAPSAPAADPPPRSRVPLVLGAIGVAIGLVAVGALVAVLALVSVGDRALAPAPALVTPAPTAIPAPAPAPVEIVEPAVAEPSPAVAEPAAPAPRPATVVAPRPEPVPVATGPRVPKALFAVRDASSIEVVCGDTRGTGTASVRLTDFPAGPCKVRTNFLGEWLEADIEVDRAREVSCEPAPGALACR